MLTSQTYDILGHLFSVLSCIGTIPYIWDKDKRILKTSISTKQKSTLMLTLFALWHLYILEEGLRFYYLGNFEYFNICYLFLIGGALTFLAVVIMLWPNDAGLKMFNATLIYSKHIAKYYTKCGFKSRKHTNVLLEISIIVSIFSCFVGCLLVNLIFIIHPANPVFIGRWAHNYVINPWIISKLLLTLAHIFHLYMAFNIFMSVAILQVFVIIGSLTLLLFTLKELNLNKVQFKTVPSLRTPKRLVLAYREAQIVMVVNLTVLGSLIVPGQALATQLVVFITFLLRQRYQNISNSLKFVMISWVGIAITTWIGILEVSGYICRHGEIVLESWKYYKWNRRREMGLMTRFRKSCKPIMIHYGRTYIIRRITVLKYLRRLLKSVFKTLITVGEAVK